MSRTMLDADRQALQAAVEVLDRLLGDTDMPDDCPHHGRPAFRASFALAEVITGREASPLGCQCHGYRESAWMGTLPARASTTLMAAVRERSSKSPIINIARRLIDDGKPVDEVLVALISAQDDHIRRLEELTARTIAREPLSAPNPPADEAGS